MRKHISLTVGLAALLAMLLSDPSSVWSQAGKMTSAGRRIRPAVTNRLVTDTTSSARTKTTDIQTASDLNAASQPDVLSPVPVESPTATEPGTAVQAATADPIKCDWISINHGGATEVAAGDLRLGVSVAQPVAGFVAGGPYQMGLGFWYGAAAAANGGCACDCFGDPLCDSISTILDVVRAVDVAFRGGAPYLDPNMACPFETTDVTCDGVTTVLDVVRMVDVAFRGGDAVALYCDPCAP